MQCNGAVVSDTSLHSLMPNGELVTGCVGSIAGDEL